jgi:hypothetical protein
MRVNHPFIFKLWIKTISKRLLDRFLGHDDFLMVIKIEPLV